MSKRFFSTLATICQMALVSSLLCATSVAGTIYNVPMTGDQEVPPVTTLNTGTAVFELSDDQSELSYDITVMGFDFGGAFTPSDANDDITGLHIHNAPAGSTGGVVFGIYNPSQDPDRVITVGPVGKIRFQGKWDAGDSSANDSLANQLSNLLGGDLYINLHTTEHPSGEIRGQIVPEPSSLALIGLGLVGIAGLRRRRK